MSTNKNTYEIIINHASKNTGEPTYEGKYKHKPGEYFISIPVSFKVNENNAYIYITDSDATEERVLNFSADEIRDTLRKVYLYHLLHYGKELTPESITLLLNGKEYTYDSSTPNFPFMFSMIRVPDDFKLTPFDEDLIIKIIKESKTQQFKKDEYACLYAFLGGIGKEHINDQFLYFWTAINSYYNLVAKEYNKKLAEQFENDANYQALDDADQKKIKMLLSLMNDEKNMHALSLLYTKDPFFTKARQIKFNTYNQTVRVDSRTNENAIIVSMSTWFYEWNEQWEDMLHTLKNPSGNDAHLSNLRDNVLDALSYKLIDPYAWVAFKFPYIFRCNSFHGSRAYLAFAGYDEPELRMVQAMCYVMKDFLNENIKNVFHKELLTENDFKRIKYMCAHYFQTSRESSGIKNYLSSITL